MADGEYDKEMAPPYNPGYGYGGEPSHPPAPYPYAQPMVTPQSPPPANFNTTNVVITQQPARMGLVPWQNTLCGSCFTAGCCFCLTTALCPCAAISQLSSHTGEHCCVPCHMGPFVTIAAARVKLRVMHNLQGDLCQDCCGMIFCTPCMMCQTKAEWDLLQQGRIL